VGEGWGGGYSNGGLAVWTPPTPPRKGEGSTLASWRQFASIL